MMLRDVPLGIHQMASSFCSNIVSLHVMLIYCWECYQSAGHGRGGSKSFKDSAGFQVLIKFLISCKKGPSILFISLWLFNIVLIFWFFKIFLTGKKKSSQYCCHVKIFCLAFTSELATGQVSYCIYYRLVRKGILECKSSLTSDSNYGCLVYIYDLLLQVVNLSLQLTQSPMDPGRVVHY